MDTLPQELIDKIAEQAHNDRHHSPYQSTLFPRPTAHSQVALACISRRWQYAFERQVFRSIQIKSNELVTFDAIVQGDRRNHLQTLSFTIILPPYSKDTADLFEQKSDQDANDETFSTAFHHLFRILSTWSPSVARKNVLCLYVRDILCPSDSSPETWAPDTIERHIYSYLRLQRAKDLPLVPIISGFDIRTSQRSSKRRIAPRTGIELLARMPMVSWAILALPDTEDRYPAIRRRNRDELASVLRSESLPSSIYETLGLLIESHAGANQTWRPANLLARDDQPDPVSSAIWEASSKIDGLRQLKIEGTFDHSLLWPGPLTTRPSSIPRTISTPFWQNITIMAITFDPRTPSGEWYFRAPDGIDIHDYPFFDPNQPEAEPDSIIDRDVANREMPPGYNITDSRESLALSGFDWDSYVVNSGWTPVWVFRLVPDQHLLFPLIEAWARAVSQMPKVRRAILRTTLRLPVTETFDFKHYDWSLRYVSPCQCTRCAAGFVREGQQETFCSGRRTRGITFRTLTWRPDGVLLDLLRGIGSRYHSSDIEEYYDCALGYTQ